jgi:chromosome segregation ATPase
MQMSFAIRDKENAVQNMTTLQRQHDALVTQRGHWDTLAETKEQVAMLRELIAQNDGDELRELRRAKEQAIAVEAEYNALQRRFRDQETKISSNEKVVFTARQNLASANQRASDSEKRAKEYQAELETLRTKLDRSEQSQAQLDADLETAKDELDSTISDLVSSEVWLPKTIQCFLADMPSGT